MGKIIFSVKTQLIYLKYKITRNANDMSVIYIDVNFQPKELGPTILTGLLKDAYSRALSHYCRTWGLLPAAFPPWAGSSLLRQPDEPSLRRARHIDAGLSADTRST